MILYSQRDARWAGHALGWGPADGTIGQYGCLDTCFAMIANDSGRAGTPATIDELFTQKQIFAREATGTFDLLPDNALDLAYPGSYQTRHVNGYDSAGITPAVKSADTYVVFFISTPSVPTHFVLAYSPDGNYIADPWTGKVGTLSGYGGAVAVHKTIYVKHVNPTPAVPAATPPPVSVAVPVPTPPPTPMYIVENEKDVVIGQPTASLESAKALADSLAQGSPGTVYVVENEKEVEVYKAQVAIPVAPVVPAPVLNVQEQAVLAQFLAPFIALLKRIFNVK